MDWRSKVVEEKRKHESFQKRFKTITKTWQKIEKHLDMYRENIADDFFSTHPYRIQLLRTKEIDEVEDPEEAMRKKLYKHSVAVINHMEMIVEFVNGNEEAKPIFFILGKQHKQALTNEKMFLEMKDSICKVIERNLGEESSLSWQMVLEYIYVNYVFPGMEMIQTI